MPEHIAPKAVSGTSYYDLIQKIYEHVENDRVNNAVLTCLRLARLTRDFVNAALFLRETGADTRDVVTTLYDDMKDLKDGAVKFVSEHSAEQWLKHRELDFSLGRDKKGDELKILTTGIGELDSEMAEWERAIASLHVPAGMHPHDTAAFANSYQERRAAIGLRLMAMRRIKERAKTLCLNYAVGMERQLEAQRHPQSFLEQIQNDVNNYFKSQCDDVFRKLQKAAQLVNSNEGEDLSLLLTQVRRAIKAAADFFYPPVAGKVKCSDGEERELGTDQYLNRLHEYLAVTFPKSSGADLLKAEFEQLSVFARRLNNLASKGVHSDATAVEAKQGLVGLYMFLYNVIAQLQRKPVVNP